MEEACGVFGIYAPGKDVARMTGFGLQALQHRGQESAGIAVGDGETVNVIKDLGLVTQVFDDASLDALVGDVAIGHVRYSTSGSKATWEAAQPHLSAMGDVLLALAHNGTLTNTNKLRARLISDGARLYSSTDSEVAAKLIGMYTQRTNHLREGIRHAMELMEGAYAMVLCTADALTPFATPAAYGRCASDGCPAMRDGSSPRRPVAWTSSAPPMCATSSRARSCASTGGD